MITSTDLARWFFMNAMVATGVAFLAAHSLLLPRLRDTPSFPWRTAAVTSLTALFCMAFPLIIAQGLRLDIRLLPLGLAAWQHGWKAYVGAAIPVIIVRVWIGGPGAFPAIVAVGTFAVMVALVVRLPKTLLSLSGLALAYWISSYVAILLLAQPPAGLEPNSPTWLLLAVIYLLSTWLLNAAQEHIQSKQRLEETLAAELQTKAAVLELIPYGVVLLDAKGRVTDLNRAARSLMEGSKLPGQILSHPDVRQSLNDGRRVQVHRMEITDSSGTERHVLVSVSPLGDGAIIGVENVTSVVQQEREEARRDRLELLGQLSAMAAHEIKNPLTTIKGFLQLMEANSEFAAHQPVFTLLHSEVNHISRVVSDFLVLSGQSPKEVVAASVDGLLCTICQIAELQHPGNRVTVKWGGEAGITVPIDERAVTQILKNLVANAYEAMPDGGELRLSRELAGELVRISVSDTGPGISAEMLPLIFRPYMTTKSTGTGLGLAISHKLATEMGGSLEVASEPGKGSTFSLFIPRP